jgi:hypothetical protein
MHRKRPRFIAMLALAACASVAPPVAQVGSTRAAIRAAEEAGAASVPAAAMHLQMARDQSALADRLIKADEPERAALVLRRAEADAELARTLARAQASALEARSMDEQADGTGPSGRTP